MNNKVDTIESLRQERDELLAVLHKLRPWPLSKPESVAPNWSPTGSLLPTGNLVLVKHTLTNGNSLIRCSATAADDIGAEWDVSVTNFTFDLKCVKYPTNLEGVYHFSAFNTWGRSGFKSYGVSEEDALKRIKDAFQYRKDSTFELKFVRSPDKTVVPQATDN